MSGTRTQPAPRSRSDTPVAERDLQREERSEDELVMHLERDQFVVETSRPVARVALSPRARAGLWGLRLFVLVVGVMVVYAFVEKLH